MMSVSLHCCRLCLQFGLPSDWNWHPDALAKQEHVRNHLQIAIAPKEMAEDPQLFQWDDWMAKGMRCCFSQTATHTESPDENVHCGDCDGGALMAKTDVFTHWRKKHLGKNRLKRLGKKRLGSGRGRTKPRRQPQKKKHKGPECGEDLTRPSHLLIHQSPDEVHCGDYGALTAKEDVFADWRKKHLGKERLGSERGQTKHGRQSQKKKHKCPECGKEFTRPYDLHRHQRVHTGERPFQCHQCGKRFTWNCHLKDHQRTVHQKQKPFNCEECGKGFGRKQHRDSHHVTVHLHQKPFQCPQCQKSFGQQCDLNVHQRSVHEKLKPFLCCHCGRGFGRKQDMESHERLHSGDRP